MKVEGIGILTATAIVASVGDAKMFKNGREMAAFLGLASGGIKMLITWIFDLATISILTYSNDAD